MKFALVSGDATRLDPAFRHVSDLRSSDGCKVREVKIWHWLTKEDAAVTLGGERNRVAPGLEGTAPVDWQEVVQHGENGEKHIGDVKTIVVG